MLIENGVLPILFNSISEPRNEENSEIQLGAILTLANLCQDNETLILAEPNLKYIVQFLDGEMGKFSILAAGRIVANSLHV